MIMHLHSYFIFQVKRLKIEKGTSDDADKFEAVADTGESETTCYFPFTLPLSVTDVNIVCFRVGAHREQSTG